ncbi:chemotaxis protein CheW [Neobacillus muris]|uniref:chemotaxis protein CheW n=1 Tax=Neobacillus muris TaxID=2941334 RepID=UPI002040CAF7|nr:chemotaxis protein CheW [Neobacillus muris]
MSKQDYKMLIFKVGQEEYGVNINQVVSIERMQPITSYPKRAPHVLGVTTVRDVVTPVVDLRAALTGVELQPTDDTRIVIVQVENKTVGLVVDAATDVLNIPADTIQQPNLLQTREISYLIGISKLGERLLILLEIEKLLEDTTNLDELKEMTEAL